MLNKKTLKEYKGVTIFFAIVTIVNIVWFMNVNPTNNDMTQASKEKVVAYNA